MTQETAFEQRCQILADLWIRYRNDENFQDFISYNDLALPFAYAITNNFIEVANATLLKSFIDEAWGLLLTGMNIEDTGFDNLDHLLSAEE